MKIERTQKRKSRMDMRFIFMRERNAMVMIGDRNNKVEPYFFCETFSYLEYGGRLQARAAARRYRDEVLQKHPQLVEIPWKEKLRDPTRGVCVQQSRPLVTATYVMLTIDGETKRRQKSFAYDPTDPDSITSAKAKAHKFRASQNERYIRERENFEKLKRGNRK